LTASRAAASAISSWKSSQARTLEADTASITAATANPNLIAIIGLPSFRTAKCGPSPAHVGITTP
jgi:hypothetical protein